MSIILHILIQNILPIFLLIGLGFILEKKFDLQMNTLTKLNFYIFVPAFSFVNLYETDIELDAVKVLAIAILLIVANYLISGLMARLNRSDDSQKYSFQNAVMFYNSGNIGIPLITLVYSTGRYLIDGATPYLSLALTFQVMVYVIQNVSINTIGFINAGRAHTSAGKAILNIFKMPTVYMVPLALLLKLVDYDIRGLPIWPVLNYGRNGLVPIALLSLGIQLAKSHVRLNNKQVYLAVFTRLIIGPLLALGVILLFRLDGLVAQVLLISSSVPTAVNTALIAVEKNNHPNFATQVVIISTVLSAFTMTGVIYLSGILFPL